MLLGDAVWSIGKLVVADIGIRLIRDDYFLAKPEEAVFPHSDLSLDGDHVTLLTPGEAEDLSKAGQTIPDVAQELAPAAWSASWAATPWPPTAIAPTSWRQGSIPR